MTSVSGNGAEFTDLSYSEDGYYPYTISEQANASASFEFTAKDFGNGYIYLKASNNDIDNITVTLPDGSVVSQPVDTKPHILDVGNLQKDDVVKIYAPYTEGQDGYLYLYAVTLNKPAFDKGYKTLKADSLNVTKFEETEIEGAIKASADGVLYTSINYDTGWTVYIDGEKLSADKYHSLGNGALLGVDITAGEHTIRFKYVPDGLIVGGLISLVTLLMLILISVIIKTGYFKFEPELYKEEEDPEETRSQMILMSKLLKEIKKAPDDEDIIIEELLEKIEITPEDEILFDEEIALLNAEEIIDEE